MRRDLAAILAGLGALILIVGPVLAGSNILTGHVNVGSLTTPVAIGTDSGRQQLVIINPTVSGSKVDCGPLDLPVTTWITIFAGGTATFGIDTGGGHWTGDKVIACLMTAGTTPTAAIQYKEEGNMADRTPTITMTPTVTPANTATPTATPTLTPT